MEKNTIPNSNDAVEYCILRCKWAKWRGPNEFDYECTCKKECNDFDQFDIPEYEKHNEEHIRREVIEKACECFHQELKHFVRMLECIKEGSSEIIDIEGSINSFRKAMEE